MLYRILAEVTMVTHFGFVLFVVAGAFLTARWPWVAFLHVPSFAWGVLISLLGWRCPLTPLEIRFRHMAGEEGFDTGFIDHYLVSIVYPEGLTRTHQILLGIGVLLLNVAVYLWVLRRRRRRPGGTAAE